MTKTRASTSRFPGLSLRLLLLHDDAEQEFAYVAGAEQALALAKQENWTVGSMNDDWSDVFAAPTP